MKPDPSDMLASTSDLLDFLAGLTGDPRFSRARGILRGRPVGRRPVDDTAALAMARSLVDAGLARSRNSACNRAAEFYAPSNQVESMRARLMKKSRTK